MKKFKSACILCSRNCGIVLFTKDKEIIQVQGDRDHPFSKGYICQKAMRLNFYQNHEDRLLHPLKRNENGTFDQITWDQAFLEIATQLRQIQKKNGGTAIATYMSGQGNHLQSLGLGDLRQTLKTRYAYSALAQEKTGDAWVNGKLFGSQSCHISEDIENADFVMFIGTNPWQSHGIKNARIVLKEIINNPNRFMLVIDPRKTETAKMANCHLQINPGTDAFLMSAMLAIIFQNKLENNEFLQKHTQDYNKVRKIFLNIDIQKYCKISNVDPNDLEKLCRRFAKSKHAVVRVDLGLQHSINSTLNSYLEKLLFLVTGHFSKKGCNNLHSWMAPIFGHSGNVFDETASNLHLPWVTQVTKTKEIAEIYPPNVLPLEINSPNENRLRALIMQNGNLVRSGAQTKAFEDAFKKLELFVVIDVTMTETANFAHYILPAASQFEKWEATFFNLDFPVNYFHLRKPIFPPLGESQPESYIYQKLWEHLNPKSFKIPFLQMILKNRKYNSILGLASFIVHILINKIAKDNKVIFIYKAFEKVFDNSKIAVAPLWAISHLYFLKNRKAVKKVKINSGEELFEKILSNHSGLNISHHQYEDCWNMLGYKNKKIHLAIDELLNSSPKLQEIDPDYPLTLIAGERRSYNANTIFQNPDWRKSDQEGFLRIHPKNAAELGVGDGQTILCRSRTGEIKVITKICETMQYNLLSLPHGYGLSYKNENEPLHKFGPNINCLSNLYDCDPISKTPYYKQLQVRLEII